MRTIAVIMAISIAAACGIQGAEVSRATVGQAGPKNNALPGAQGFYPSPEKPVGWRGDSTGRYPGATPPVTWKRRVKDVLNIRCQAEKPKGGEPGKDASAIVINPKMFGQSDYGKPLNLAGATPDPSIGKDVITQWLVLGPIPAGGPAALLPDEGKAEPDAGSKALGLTWEKNVDYATVFKDSSNHIAYYHSYLHCGTEGGVWVRLTHNDPLTVWINGKQVYNNGAAHPAWIMGLGLQKGWNRLTCRLTHTSSKIPGCGFSVCLRAGGPYEMENVAWITRLPHPSVALPVVVGEKVFVTSEPTDLVCIDKKTGKILWLRSNHAGESLSDEDGKLYADKLKTAAEQIVALHKLDDEIVGQINAKGSFEQRTWEERKKLEFGIPDTMAGIDKKFRRRLPVDLCWPDWASGTPCSDGKYVYVHFTNGAVACYDLDGRKIWTCMVYGGRPEHGNHSSPVLVDGKLVVVMHKDVTALDARTGKKLWTGQLNGNCGGSFFTAKIGSDTVVIGPSGDSFRVTDGKVMTKSGLTDGQDNAGTPVVEDGVVCQASWAHKGFIAARYPGYDSFIKFPVKDAGFPMASPLMCKGLIYYVSDKGLLAVADAKTLKLVYEKYLDLNPVITYVTMPGLTASPTLAGGYIYIMDNQGHSIVMEPGDKFKAVASNVLQHTRNGFDREQINSTPVFDGKLMFVRGEDHLYCISEKSK